jgi:hypothetical protein
MSQEMSIEDFLQSFFERSNQAFDTIEGTGWVAWAENGRRLFNDRYNDGLAKINLAQRDPGQYGQALAQWVAEMTNWLAILEAIAEGRSNGTI